MLLSASGFVKNLSFDRDGLLHAPEARTASAAAVQDSELQKDQTSGSRLKDVVKQRAFF